jgi:hypothetical protein
MESRDFYLKVRTPGFDVEPPGDQQIVVGRTSSGYVPTASKTFKLTAQPNAGYLELHVAADVHGNIAVFKWDRIEGPKPEPPPPPPPPPVARGSLKAWLACGGSLDVVAGELPPVSCNVNVQDWCSNTANPVEVSFPDLKDQTWGVLPDGIQVFPTNVRVDPGTMFNAGVSDHPEYVFQFMWRATSSAAVGEHTVKIRVQQAYPADMPGCGGEVELTMKINVLPPRPRRPPVPSGRNGPSGPVNTFAGEWDTSVGPMVVRVVGNRATGVLPGMGAAFNGIVKDGQLRGEFRDGEGTGSFLLILDPESPKFVGAVIRPAQPRQPGAPGRPERPAQPPRLGTWTGTSVLPGDPPTGEPATTTKLTFQAAQRRPTQGEIFQAPIWILNGADLRNLNVTLTYDPEVIEPAEPPMVPGNLMGGAAFETNFPNRLRGQNLAGFRSQSGLSAPGAGTLVTFRFKAIGNVGDRTPLTLEVTTINRGASGERPAFDVIHGMVHIVGKRTPGDGTATPPRSPPPPSSGGLAGNGGGTGNGTGTGNGAGGGAIPPPPATPPSSPLTMADALLALKMSVKQIPENLVLDVTSDDPASGAPDGKVTSRDAYVIAQRAVAAVAAGGQ